MVTTWKFWAVPRSHQQDVSGIFSIRATECHESFETFAAKLDFFWALHSAAGWIFVGAMPRGRNIDMFKGG